jgi:hypothetical protein
LTNFLACDLICTLLPDIVRINKSRRMRWEENVACIETSLLSNGDLSLSQVIKWPEREADHFPPSSAQLYKHGQWYVIVMRSAGGG